MTGASSPFFFRVLFIPKVPGWPGIHRAQAPTRREPAIWSRMGPVLTRRNSSSPMTRSQEP